MVELRECESFLAEAFACGRVGECAGGKHFDRDVAIQLLVASAVDHAHAAFAEFAEDSIVTEKLVNHRMPAPEGILQAELRKFMQGIVKTMGSDFNRCGCERSHCLGALLDLGTRTTQGKIDTGSTTRILLRVSFQIENARKSGERVPVLDV